MPKFVMSDGREFTDYSPACDLNNQLQSKYNLKNSYEYRQFLQKNAEMLIKENTTSVNSYTFNMCPVCKKALEVNNKPLAN